MSRKHPIYTFFAVLFAVSVASGETIVHNDQAVLLSDLLVSGQTISVGDKIFSDFAYSKVGDMPEAMDISVIPIVTDGDYGVRFQGGFIDLVGGAASDSLITFSVEAPEPLIKGARLYGNVDGGEGGFASITETFLPQLPTTALTITAGVNLDDTASFTPVKKLAVQKDILLLAGTTPATLSFVDQAFPQVPEPNSALLLAIGFIGVSMNWRKRR